MLNWLKGKHTAWSFNDLEITPEEQKIIIKTLAEWFENSIHILSEDRTAAVISMIDHSEKFNEDDNFIVQMGFEFVMGDIISILGGIRRGKDRC